MSNILKVHFTDFWPDFNPQENLFIDLLHKNYEVQLTAHNPDILIYSCYGWKFLQYDCHRIFYTAENVRPNFLECDHAFTFDHHTYNGKNDRLPLYMFTNLDVIRVPKDPEKLYAEKDKFCNMVVSNPDGRERNEFFQILNSRKRVDSGGRYQNNIGKPVDDKLSFIKSYQFSFAFENTSYPGYVTEKIIEPMRVGSIPIYWGSPRIQEDFNPKSFVNAHAFDNLNQLSDYVLDLSNDKQKMLEMMAQPYLHSPEPDGQNYHYWADRLKKILDQLRGEIPIAQKAISSTLLKGRILKKRLISKLTGKPYWYA